MTDPIDLMSEWWRLYQPDPRVSFKDMLSGGRATAQTSGTDVFPGGEVQKVSNAQRQTGSCQYWIKGLASPCVLWNGNDSRCTYSVSSEGDSPPTGYGVKGGCDQLGRRDWCDKYLHTYDPPKLDEFVCIAPCIEKSGLGRQIKGISGFISYRPLKIEEIKGYNPDDTIARVGQCDGCGLGRGKEGKGLDFLELLYDKLPICRQYRPQQMGFGAIQPRPFHGSTKPGKPYDPEVNYIPKTPGDLHDGSKADPLTQMDVRLPFVFQLYNSRSAYQKCAHWENIVPAFFTIDHVGSDPSFFNIVMGDGQSYCKCTDSSCGPYKNMVGDWPEGVPWILLQVWAEYKGIVCNGAKPECPCYTGEWIYCTDNNMRDGMRITADQIFELRFWTSNWSSQAEYDAFYLSKPGTTKDGVSDISTANIYTFTQWEKLDPTSPSNSKMMGKMHHMCMPAPLNMREFDVKTYITLSDAKYPLLGESLGTMSTEGSVTFPTLVRELDDPTDFVPDINVIYPYLTVDPWSLLACDNPDIPDYCFHDSNLMEDPLISAIGCASLNRPVYVLNVAFSDSPLESTKYIDRYIRAGQVPKSKWKIVCQAIETDIKALDSKGKGIHKTTSNNYGFFEVNRIKLKLNAMNTLYIICNWITADYPEYTFRKIKVKSRYWAALITQDSGLFTHGSEQTWFNFFPTFFYPQIDMVKGQVQITQKYNEQKKQGGKVQSIISTYALYVYSLIQDVAYYSYCINQYNQQDANVIKWVQVGATGYIWGEISNKEISYLWGFSVTSASISYNNPDPDSPNFFCGSPADTIVLEVIYPETILSPGIALERNKEIIRRALPPNAFLLKAPKPMPLFNSKWTLSVEYSYQRIDTFVGTDDDCHVVWPYNMGTEWSLNQFAESPFKITTTKDSPKFFIADVGGFKTRGSMKIMAFIADENGRIQTAASTKLLLQGYNGGCRSVDIDYKYIADAQQYTLEPAGGYFTWRGSPKAPSVGEPLTHGKRAKCGDHECAPGNCIGPMWFPFNKCTSFDYYDNVSNANYCTKILSEASPNLSVMGFSGWRYVVAEEYKAWISMGGNWAACCGSPWTYHYSEAGGSRFAGNGNKKAKVDLWYYIFMGWALPPFGNEGRGFIERYITRDFSSHIDMSMPDPVTKFRYMPMVFDKEDLFSDLNPFANPDEATPLHEPFSHFSMMSNYTAEFIGERISSERYRFDDIIEPVHHGNCMYPYPLMESVGGMYRVIRYGFKDSSYVWAWPEFWKPIERKTVQPEDDASTSVRFMEVTRPEYYFDYNKKEHRLITDEGSHILKFEPPKIDDAGNMSHYPSVSLDGAHPRFFKLLYGDDYTSENVEWMDESATGEVGSSGGGSIYSVCNNGEGLNGLYVYTSGTQWLHDYDTLFDANASQEPDEKRKAYLGKSSITGKDVYLYYNRGLIAFLPRNRLQYLPIKVDTYGTSPKLMTSTFYDPELNSITCFWDLTEQKEPGIALIVSIGGMWGIAPSTGSDSDDIGPIIYSMPGIEVIEGRNILIDTDETGFPLWPENSTLVGSTTPATGKHYVPGGYDSYTIEFELSRKPERIISRFAYFMIRVFAAPGTELLKIKNISMRLGNYVNGNEPIKVWERRYLVSSASNMGDGLNADGPDTDSYRTYSRSYINAGQYFPFEDKFTIVDHKDGSFLDKGKTDFEEGGKIVSKLNMVGFTEIFREDEKLAISMGNLKDMELNPQRKLYEEALVQDDYDTLNFTGMIHPAVNSWLKTLGITFNTPGDMPLEHMKIDWDHNNHKNLLVQGGDFITPGGHYYKWGAEAIREKCYVIGGLQNVYIAKYVHHRHAGGDKGEEDALPTGAAYAGYGRLWYYESNMAIVKALGQSELGMFTDPLTGAKNAVFKRSG